MIPPSHLRAMRQEIEKRAINLAQVGSVIANRPKLVSAALGAGGGAVLGAGREALKAPEERNYLGGTLRGAALGGVAGTATGAVGRGLADTRLLQRAAGQMPTAGSVVTGTARRIGTGLSDFAKRQAHGFTGKFEESMIDPLKRKQQVLNLRGQPLGVKEVREEITRRQRNIKSGLSNLPGIVKGLGKDPKGMAKGMWREGLGGGGVLGAGVALGLPVAVAAPDLYKGDESAQGGRNMKQKLVRHGAGIGTGFLTGGMPIIPQMVAGSLVDTATSRLTGEKKIKRELDRSTAGRTIGGLGTQ